MCEFCSPDPTVPCVVCGGDGCEEWSEYAVDGPDGKSIPHDPDEFDYEGDTDILEEPDERDYDFDNSCDPRPDLGGEG